MIHTGPIHVKAHTHDDCDCEECCRVPNDVHYYDLESMLADGFELECSNCGRQLGYDDSDDDDDLPELDPVCTVFKGSRVVCHAYCNAACHDIDFDERANRKAVGP